MKRWSIPTTTTWPTTPRCNTHACGLHLHCQRRSCGFFALFLFFVFRHTCGLFVFISNFTMVFIVVSLVFFFFSWWAGGLFWLVFVLFCFCFSFWVFGEWTLLFNLVEWFFCSCFFQFHGGVGGLILIGNSVDWHSVPVVTSTSFSCGFHLVWHLVCLW
jgi:hypothetical protein